jgi:hypothetical protein
LEKEDPKSRPVRFEGALAGVVELADDGERGTFHCFIALAAMNAAPNWPNRGRKESNGLRNSARNADGG